MLMDVAITKMSSKGQVVIPAEMRRDFTDGDKLIVFRNKDQLIMKHASKLDANFQEDLKFAKKTEEAWQRINAGKGEKMDFDSFIGEMKKW